MNNNQFGPLGPLLSAPPIAPLYAANLLMMPPFFAPPPAPVPLPVLPTHTHAHAHMHTHVQQPQAYAQQQPQTAAAQGLPSAGDVVECVMRQGQFDALRQRLSDAVRSHELVARLQAHARDLVDRHPQVQHQVRTGTESTLALHGVLGPPAAGARAQMANALFSSPLYREMRDFTRRLVNMPPLAPDVQSAVDRAAEHAVDLLAKPDVTDLTAAKKPPAAAALSVNDLLARKPPSLPLKAAAAPPPPRAAVLGKAKAKAPLKDTEILIPRDASLLGLRYLIESEQAQAAADGDDDDDSISDDADVESNGGAELSKQAETASRPPLPDVEDGDDDADADPLALPTPKAAKVVATKVYKFHCSTCNAGYNRTKDLGAHMTNNHGAAPTPDLFVCVDCGMAFAYPNKLTSHRAAKHADKVAAEPPRAAEPADADASQREVDRAAKRKRRADKAVAAAAEKARATEAAAAVADEMPPPVDDAAPPSSSKSERKRRPRREPVEPIEPAAADAPVAVAADDDGGTAPAADHGERKRRRRSAPEDGEAAEDSNAPVDILGGDTAAEPSTGSKSRKPRDRTKHYACDKCELRFDRASRLERHIGIAHAAPLGDAADQLDAGAVAVVAVDAAAPEESARKRERRERRSRRESDAPPPAAESGDGTAAVADPDGGAAPVADDGESRKRDRRDRRSRHSHSRDADAADVVPTEAGDEANVDAAADSAPHSASKRSRPSDEKRFLCPHCSFRFDRRGKLQTHIDAQHSGAAPADGGESGAAANDNDNDTTTDQPAEQVDAATDAGGAEATDAAKRPRRAARK